MRSRPRCDSDRVRVRHSSRSIHAQLGRQLGKVTRRSARGAITDEAPAAEDQLVLRTTANEVTSRRRPLFFHVELRLFVGDALPFALVAVATAFAAVARAAVTRFLRRQPVAAPDSVTRRLALGLRPWGLRVLRTARQYRSGSRSRARSGARGFGRRASCCGGRRRGRRWCRRRRSLRRGARLIAGRRAARHASDR